MGGASKTKPVAGAVITLRLILRAVIKRADPSRCSRQCAGSFCYNQFAGIGMVIFAPVGMCSMMTPHRVHASFPPHVAEFFRTREQSPFPTGAFLAGRRMVA